MLPFQKVNDRYVRAFDPYESPFHIPGKFRWGAKKGAPARHPRPVPVQNVKDSESVNR